MIYYLNNAFKWNVINFRPIKWLTCACQMPWMFQWMYDYLGESHAFGNSSIQTSYCCVQQPFWPLKQTGRTIILIILISSPWGLNSSKKSICENIINVCRGEGRHFLRELTLYGLEQKSDNYLLIKFGNPKRLK